LLHSEARGVITPVFEALQALEPDACRVLFSDVSDDATHNFILLTGETTRVDKRRASLQDNFPLLP
jgi:hypothetical protein